MKKTTSNSFATFVVVGWNNKDLLEECFQSIEAQTYKDHSTVYVDNGSSDDSVAYVAKNFPAVIILSMKTNMGFAIGNNKGIEEAFKNDKCSYIALLNSDARLASDWLETLIKFADENLNGASFQTPTYDYYDHNFLDSRGIIINHRGQAVQLGHREVKPDLTTRKVFGVNAAAALFSRKFLDTQPFGNDYFDSDMWMYLEDVDLAARAIVMGWDNWFVNQSEAYHMGSASSNKNPGFSVYMVYRNNLALLVKNLPYGIIMKLLPGLITSDIKSIYQLYRGHNYIAIKSILRGRYRGIHLALKFTKKHRSLKQESTITARQLWQLMCT